MASAPTKYLDLDAIEPSTTANIKLNGATHALKAITVEDFITNTKAMQGLGSGTAIETELELTIQMILRSFPTMTADALQKLELEKLYAIIQFANTFNGAEKTETEAKADAEANPPQTAPSNQSTSATSSAA